MRTARRLSQRITQYRHKNQSKLTHEGMWKPNINHDNAYSKNMYSGKIRNPHTTKTAKKRLEKTLTYAWKAWWKSFFACEEKIIRKLEHAIRKNWPGTLIKWMIEKCHSFLRQGVYLDGRKWCLFSIALWILSWNIIATVLLNLIHERRPLWRAHRSFMRRKTFVERPIEIKKKLFNSISRGRLHTPVHSFTFLDTKRSIWKWTKSVLNEQCYTHKSLKQPCSFKAEKKRD